MTVRVNCRLTRRAEFMSANQSISAVGATEHLQERAPLENRMDQTIRKQSGSHEFFDASRRCRRIL